MSIFPFFVARHMRFSFLTARRIVVLTQLLLVVLYRVEVGIAFEVARIIILVS